MVKLFQVERVASADLFPTNPTERPINDFDTLDMNHRALVSGKDVHTHVYMYIYICIYV